MSCVYHGDPTPALRVSSRSISRATCAYIESVVELVRRECAELMAFSAAQIALNVPVALTEAISNAILRGNGDDPAKHVHVRAEVDTRAPRSSRWRDEGAGFDLDASLVDPTTPENLDREDGRGLFLMRKLMDRVERVEVPHGQRRANDAEPRMSELAQVLAAFHDATRCEAAVWMQTRPSDAAPTLASPATDARARAIVAFRRRPTARRTCPSTRRRRPRRRSARTASRVARARPVSRDRASSLTQLHEVPAARSSTQYLQSALEVEHAANELAERYEEINLLYTISEILGRTVSLDEATKTILTRGVARPSARAARSMLVHDRETNTLRAVAALGVELATVPPISLDDPCSVSAHVFRTQHPMLAEGGRDALPARRRAIAAARCSPCRSCGRRPRRAAPSRSAS